MTRKRLGRTRLYIIAALIVVIALLGTVGIAHARLPEWEEVVHALEGEFDVIPRTTDTPAVSYILDMWALSEHWLDNEPDRTVRVGSWDYALVPREGYVIPEWEGVIVLRHLGNKYGPGVIGLPEWFSTHSLVAFPATFAARVLYRLDLYD